MTLTPHSEPSYFVIENPCVIRHHHSTSDGILYTFVGPTILHLQSPSWCRFSGPPHEYNKYNNYFHKIKLKNTKIRFDPVLTTSFPRFLGSIKSCSLSCPQHSITRQGIQFFIRNT